MVVGSLALAALLLVTACTGTDSASGPPPAGTVDTLPADAVQIQQKAPYTGAAWSYLVVDPASGDVLHSQNAAVLQPTGSQAKEFTIGTSYDRLGVDSTLTTPVYKVGSTAGDTLAGNLVLVASGDLALGGRGAMQGRFDFATVGVDHVYADVIPGAKLPTDDPLAGLDAIAQQVKAAGITRIVGDVLIDTRLWTTYQGEEGPVPPIFVNDNLLDVQATPGTAPGQPASVRTVPQTSAYRAQSNVTTGTPGSTADLNVQVSPTDPRLLLVTGTVPPGDPSLTVYRIPDAANWARTLLIEALARAGITVTAPTLAANNEAALPAQSTYAQDQRVATITSPALKLMGGMILATSYDTGANDFLCLLAVHQRSTSCDDGLKLMRADAGAAGIPDTELMLIDGQGGGPSSVATPQALVKWLEYVDKQPWGAAFREGLPVLGERGSLSLSGQNSPAKGKVIGKTGTLGATEPLTGRLLIEVQALSGYMDVGNGRNLIYVVSVTNALFPDPAKGIFEVGDDVAMFAAAFQQAQSAR